MSPSLSSRALGSIWGVCVGDALGGPVQFMNPNTFKPITGLRFVFPFQEPAGSYSDDGAMTLALAQSIIDSRGTYNHVLSIEYFIDWLTNGRFSTTDRAWDEGLSTRLALEIWEENGVDNLQHTQCLISQKLDAEHRSGNGSLMRIAPIGLIYWRDAAAARRLAREQSLVTHPSLACLEACEVYTELLCGVMRGESKKQLCHLATEFTFTHSDLAKRLSRYRTISDWQAKSPSNIRSSGWVVDTLEVALWGFFKYDSWADGALAVANLGGDADTAAAVYGGLAGAFYGFELLQMDWVEGMQNKGLIGEVASKLSELVSTPAPE